MPQLAYNKYVADAAWTRLKQGDAEALDEIFRLYYQDLYLYGIKMISQPDLVKDSIQDVFVSIWEHRSTLGEVQNIKAYFLTSLRRRLLFNKEQYLKKIAGEYLQNQNSQNFIFSVSEFQENEEISQLLFNLLSEAINTLPDRQRELIFLRFYYNLPYTEIGLIMDINEQSVKNLMQRALYKLREKIDCQMWKDIDGLENLLIVFFHFFQKK